MVKNFTDLTGRKAIVTGAAQGLSRGMAEGLMEAGAEVAIIDLNPKVMEVAAEYVEKGYSCHGVIGNLANVDDRKKAFDECVRALGDHLDIIVNGAGVQKRHPSEEFPYEDWEFVININLNAVFSMSQLAGQQFIKQNSRGKIINIASMLSFFGGYTVPAYAASKGINCNCLAPGYMDTDMNVALTNPDNPRFKEITDRIPANAWGTPEDMKGPVVFLASDASNYLDGAVIPVDGGYLVK